MAFYIVYTLCETDTISVELAQSFIYPAGLVIFSSAGHYIWYTIVIYTLTLPALENIYVLYTHKKQVSSSHDDKRKTRVGTPTTTTKAAEGAKWTDFTEEMQAICRQVRV
jgi:hypothetical protein